MLRRSLLLALAVLSILAPDIAAAQGRPRVIVLTDIGNEPDDSESLVRFLAYANEFDIEGLVASTSTWQRDRVRPDLIAERLDAYAAVRQNLARHAPGYPTAAALRAVMRSGSARYGMAGVGTRRDTDASRLIVAAVDRVDTRPVWVLAWGGAVDLAQALWHVRATRTPHAVARFVAKLRVYSISDQDDAGPWARRSFPDLFWIASIHGWGQYTMATWSGISGDRRNGERWPDSALVGDPWLQANIRRGPLGALYPMPAFIMEGDTPSFLGLIGNGLNDPADPEYGGWGGRYMRSGPIGGHRGDTKDVLERDDQRWASNQAGVFRWRRAFQNDFAARIAWTLPDAAANHPPVPMWRGTAGTAPVRIAARSGETVSLDATGSRDPDGQPVAIRWWQYREVGGLGAQPAVTIDRATTLRAGFVAPAVDKPTDLHLILEVEDGGNPQLTRYRRVIVTVVPA